MQIANRTIFTRDNLEVMRGMDSESIDLIYLDPPFNSNTNYAAPIGSEAAGAAFKDTWTLSDLDEAWIGQIADEHPAVHEMLTAAGVIAGRSTKAYLTYMAIRLLEMQRILKSNGSLYLHCDQTASHYLKMLLDAVFGGARFQTEITWRRTSAHNDSRRFGNVCDRVIVYGTRDINADSIRVSLDREYVEAFYRHSDARGQYQVGDLTGAGPRQGETGLPWRTYDPNSNNRHWAVPRTGRYAEWIDSQVLPGYTKIIGVHARLDALDAASMIQYSESDGMPRIKRYLAASPGQVPTNLWADIRPIAARSRERTGYPTQKPLRLLERIVGASSNEGDVVFDPFCGCATACVAAEKLGRQWIGIDVSEMAFRLVRDRLEREVNVGNGDRPSMLANVTHRTDIPVRTDSGEAVRSRDIKHVLFGRQEGVCGGCRTMFPFRNMTVDHVVPTVRGGQDIDSNLQLLCQACNPLKGDRPQTYLVTQLRIRGILPINGGR